MKERSLLVTQYQSLLCCSYGRSQKKLHQQHLPPTLNARYISNEIIMQLSVLLLKKESESSMERANDELARAKLDVREKEFLIR